MGNIFTLVLDEFGAFDVLIPESAQKASWDEAKRAAKAIGKGYRLPLDFELEELFKSSLFRGIINNSSYWSGTETAKMRARSQKYRNGGDYRALWYQHPGDVESKDTINYFFLIRMSKKKKVQTPLSTKILELALYDSIRKEYHLNNYVKDGLDRSKVFASYKQSNNSKSSFLLMLKWGGVRPVNLQRVKAYRLKQIESKLTKFNSLIGKLSAEVLIDEYLSNEDIRISGVNLSFITKHLYFTKPSKFLIYDRFMINLHAAMIIEDDPSLIEQYFNESKKKLDFSIRYNMQGKAYSDFIERFKSLFLKINEELSKRSVKSFNSLGEFEAFLFGNSQEKNLSNPRVMIKNFIIENR
jgi:hypothetical protein